MYLSWLLIQDIVAIQVQHQFYETLGCDSA